MYAYQIDALQVQPPRADMDLGWIKRRIEAMIATRRERQEITYLRTLDCRILNDMGIDTAALDRMWPKLLDRNPGNSALDALNGKGR